MIAYTIWADDRLFAAAEGVSDEQWRQVQGQVEHMLGTQRWWHGNWTGIAAEDPAAASLAAARAAYASSHEALRAYVADLTQEGWEREEAWWKPWGYDATMQLGESITQLFYHGAQHRSEIAVLLTEWGHSPGDLDYLTYLEQRGRAAG
jgi:uncharacterized damage-inducible protein DinB